jgi:pilus assembly protein Flp/PilA
MRRLAAFITDERGMTMVEYAIAGALIALAVLASFDTLGSAAETLITQLGEAII